MATPDLQNTLPFEETKIWHAPSDVNGVPVTPIIQAVTSNNFFKSHGTWTCYRQNYFSVKASYDLSPNVGSQSLFLEHSSSLNPAQILTFAMCLSATNRKQRIEIRILQHTQRSDGKPFGLPRKIETSPNNSVIPATDSEPQASGCVYNEPHEPDSPELAAASIALDKTVRDSTTVRVRR